MVLLSLMFIVQNNFYMTFLNWPELIHCPDFIFLIASFAAEEDRSTIELNLRDVTNELDDLIDNGITLNEG